MNAWLEAAEKIHLDPASQPLVTSAELESFDGQNMKLTVDLEKLTAHDMVAKLAAELKKVLGSDVHVTVTTAPTKYQNLRTLYAQRFLAEKQKKLSELKKDKRILSFMKVFNVEPKAEDLDLLDKEGKVRTI
jgi:DNA polymerase-3 subunit gamma/tau